MMQVRINGGRTRVLWLRKPTYLIGRSAACNIRMADENLEPVHACLKVEGDVVRLVRQNDALIKVNGSVLEAETEVSHGDAIAIGKHLLSIVDPDQEKDSAQEEADQPNEDQGRSSAWVLRAMSPALGAKCFDIAGSLLVGRARDCDIRLGEAHLSRHHARLSLGDDGLELEDLGSANGSFVNGRRVTRAWLKNGDEVSFDTLRFRVLHREAAQASTEGEETTIRGAIQEPPRPRPTGLPTAIEVQHENLRRLREERLYSSSGDAPDHLSDTGEKTGSSGWVAAFAVAIIALVGVVWGTTSFLGATVGG